VLDQTFITVDHGITDLFKKGDMVGVVNPVKKSNSFEYGIETILFTQPFIAQKELVSLSQIDTTLPKDFEGNLDFQLFQSPVLVSDLREKQTGIHFLAVIHSFDCDQKRIVLGADHKGEKIKIMFCPRGFRIFLNLRSQLKAEEKLILLFQNLYTQKVEGDLVLMTNDARFLSINYLTTLSCDFFWKQGSSSKPIPQKKKSNDGLPEKHQAKN